MQKILIIEDEVSIRNVLVRILKDENKNFVIDLCITIFLNEYVGIVLINNIETIIKYIGTVKS